MALHACPLGHRALAQELRCRNIASLDQNSEARPERSANAIILTKDSET